MGAPSFLVPQPTILHKAVNYTITPQDVNAPRCVLFADASGGNRKYTLPTVANLNGRIAEVVLDTDPAGNKAEIVQSDGSTVVWAGRAKGDHVSVTSDGTNYKIIDSRYTFVSAEQTITAAGALNIAHNAPRAPAFDEVSWYLVCKTIEGNYSVDDQVPITLPGGTNGSTFNGMGITAIDATNVSIIYGSAGNTYNIANKTNGSRVEITNANWRLVMRISMKGA